MLGGQESSAVPHLDLHSHILPGVDDGPESMTESVELIAESVRQGALGIAATPHRSPWAYNEPISAMEERLADLCRACETAQVRVELYMGGETFLIPELAHASKDLELVTFNGSRYLLLELPFDNYPLYVEETVFALQLRGFKLILAHAERYARYQQDVNQIIPLLERGVLAQINAGSLAGRHGNASQTTAEVMLEHHMAHLIASDSHSVDARPPAVASSFGRLIEIVGQQLAEAMVLHVPRMIVQDAEVPTEAPVAQHNRHFWQMRRN